MKILRNITILAVLFFGSVAGGAMAQMLPFGRFVNIASAAASWLGYTGAISGSLPAFSCFGGGQCTDVAYVNITGNSVASGSTVTASGFGVHNTINSGAYTGLGNAFLSQLSITAATGNGISGAYVSSQNIASASSPDNGTGGTPGGSLWASNPNAFLSSGATNWLWLAGQEVDTTAGAGSSVAQKYGVVIVQGGNDAVVGSTSNVALEIDNQTGAQGWDCGVCIGGYSGIFPVTANGTMFGAWAHAGVRNNSGASVPTTNAGTALYGVDLSNVTFAAGGAPYLAPLITPASSAASCKQGAIEWDAGFIYICTAASTWKRAALSAF